MINADIMRTTEREFTEWIQRVRAAYCEDPGLRLTCPQAARFLGLELRACHAILTALVATGFLRSSGGDAFVRAFFP